MAKKKISDFPDATIVNNEDLLLIMQNGITKKAKVENILKGSSESKSIEGLDFISANGTEYRVSIGNLGELNINRIIPTINSQYSGLIINQIYGGGIIDDGGTSVSHSFIELYNTTENTIDLNGLSVQYAELGTSWTVIPLVGTIPSKTSYLIRGASHNTNATIIIDDFDLDVDGLVMYNKGIKVLLCSNTAQCSVANPYKDRVNEYIDMIGCGEFESSIDGSEIVPVIGQSKQKSIRRLNFADTQHNQFDCEVVDFRLPENEWKRPRSISYGAWSGQGIQIPSLEDYEQDLKILQVYGGGSSAACSHHFVELYNKGTKSMPLEGFSLFGATYSSPTWQHIPLSGTIPPKHSFLIRGIPSTGTYLVSIAEGDLSTSLALNKAMKVFLIQTTDPMYLEGKPNPFNFNGGKVTGYIDGFGCCGNSGTVGGTVDVIDGYEGEPPCGGDPGTTKDSFGTGGNSKQTSMRRRSLIDNDNNAMDFEALRYANWNIDTTLHEKVPRNLASGEWVL